MYEAYHCNHVLSPRSLGVQPRYMQKLLQSAEQRRHQQERRIERQVQQEREREGDEFADKEQFVTEAYRQRLLERKQEEEQERRIKQIEGEATGKQEHAHGDAREGWDGEECSDGQLCRYDF